MTVVNPTGLDYAKPNRWLLDGSASAGLYGVWRKLHRPTNSRPETVPSGDVLRAIRRDMDSGQPGV
jgi:hypothetical protein